MKYLSKNLIKLHTVNSNIISAAGIRKLYCQTKLSNIMAYSSAGQYVVPQC